jgi:hypothetical protein
VKDEIKYYEDGHAMSFTGKGGVSVLAMTVLASGLKLYAETGIKMNRASTPTAMMRAARMYLNETVGWQRALADGIKPKDYIGMSTALYSAAQTEKVRIAALAGLAAHLRRFKSRYR